MAKFDENEHECVREDRFKAIEDRLDKQESKTDKIEEMFSDIKEDISNLGTSIELNKQKNSIISAAAWIVIGAAIAYLSPKIFAFLG